MFESANIPQVTGFNPANQVTNIRVEKLLMFETGTYYPQHRRPYVASSNVADVYALLKVVRVRSRQVHSVVLVCSSLHRPRCQNRWRVFRMDGVSAASAS
jgi:hypothetical protein